MKKSLKEKKVLIYSPDGFCIDREHIPISKRHVSTKLDEWISNYQRQGYYSSRNNGRIPLDELKEYCYVKEV